MQAANLQLLRVKYRKIIQGQDSQEEEIRKSISFMKPKLGKRVLTEHCENLTSSKIKDSSSNTVFVALKERIAQGLKELSGKEEDIMAHKQQIAKLKLKISLLQSQLSEQQSNIEQRNTKIAQQKVNASILQKEIERLKHIIEGHSLDKELVFKQTEFYKKEIKDLKNENKKLKVKLQQQQKEINLIQTMKNNNSRLKQNIKRMQQIINECCQDKVTIDLTDKFYIGKPLKEYNCWFPQNLVGEVEAFLRKWQVGFNNKEFIDSLVKFIDQVQKKTKKNKSSSKPKLEKSNHKKRQSNNHYNASQICLDSQSANKSLKKSILINKYKKRNKTYTGSLFEDEKDLKATKVIEEYQNALTEVLQQNEIKPKKIMQLSEELKQYFINAFDETKAKIQK